MDMIPQSCGGGLDPKTVTEGIRRAVGNHLNKLPSSKPLWPGIGAYCIGVSPTAHGEGGREEGRGGGKEGGWEKGSGQEGEMRGIVLLGLSIRHWFLFCSRQPLPI